MSKQSRNPLIWGALLLIAAQGYAGPRRAVEVDPRSRQRSLKFQLGPYYCSACAEEGRTAAEPREVVMLGRTVEALAEACDVGARWIAIETPRFKILSTLKRGLVKRTDSKFAAADLARLAQIFPPVAGRSKVMLDPHQRAHLYQIRVERLYAHFRALTNNKKPLLGMERPYEVLLFSKYAPHHRVAHDILGRKRDRTGVCDLVKADGTSMAFTTAESLFSGDANLHDNVRHHVAHNLTNGYGNYYRRTWAFLDAGIAHYYERREHESCGTLCHTGTLSSKLSKAKWSKRVYRLVRRGKDSPLASWCEKNDPHRLDTTEHMLAWSFVEWMISVDPQRFTRLLDELQDLKAKPTAARAIENVYGLTPGELQRQWREYVKREYKR